MHHHFMNFMFVLGHPNPFPGAGWIRTSFFAKNWRENGHNVDVIGVFTYHSLRKRGIKLENGIGIINVSPRFCLINPLSFLLNTLFTFISFLLVCIIKRPDYVIISVPPGDVGVGAYLVCQILRIDYVVDYRDEWEDTIAERAEGFSTRVFYRYMRYITFKMYNGARFVVTVTNSFSKNLGQRGIVDVRLVMNGADTNIMTPLPKTTSPIFKLCHMGGIGGYYDLSIVLKAISYLLNEGFENIELVLIGKGEIDVLKSVALDLEVSDKVSYLGPISDRMKLAETIAATDVGLLIFNASPLWKGAIPTKLFEYSACGLPVIATTLNGSLVQQIIENNDIGLNVEPGDAIGLAKAIRFLLQNREYRTQAGNRSRRLVEAKFDRRRISQNFLEMIVMDKSCIS